jgi:hypothetical protein
LASSSEAVLFLFPIERMRLSLSPHPQLSVIAPPRRSQSFAVRTVRRSPEIRLGGLLQRFSFLAETAQAFSPPKLVQ